MQLLDQIVPPTKARPDLKLSPRLEAVVMKALAKNRDERYRTMTEVHAALADVLVELDRAELESSLPPVPPGADLPTAQMRPRTRPATKQLHEPEFVGTRMPLRVPMEDDHDTIIHNPRGRWRWLVGAIVVAAAATGSYLLITHHEGVPANALAPRDASAIAIMPIAGDAGVAMIDQPTDAAIAIVPHAGDAGIAVAHPANDAGVGALPTGPHPAEIELEVITNPSEANVFVGHNYRGPTGVHIREPYGTHLTIECKAPHYKGSKAVVFDGTVTAVYCSARRLPFCVDGLHNPLDPDCEQAPVIKPAP
jgi:hypothetical protein